MDPIDLAEQFRKELEKKEKQVQETYMSGGLIDMEHHKYLQGQLEALYYMQDFIKNYFKTDNE
jgi:hypothetical protein|tara:strand:+ start:616 stop:804 length:189 start_codon:yes stop_codon:yes gene_type:complete